MLNLVTNMSSPHKQKYETYRDMLDNALRERKKIDFNSLRKNSVKLPVFFEWFIYYDCSERVNLKIIFSSVIFFISHEKLNSCNPPSHIAYQCPLQSQGAILTELDFTTQEIESCKLFVTLM